MQRTCMEKFQGKLYDTKHTRISVWWIGLVVLTLQSQTARPRTKTPKVSSTFIRAAHIIGCFGDGSINLLLVSLEEVWKAGPFGENLHSEIGIPTSDEGNLETTELKIEKFNFGFDWKFLFVDPYVFFSSNFGKWEMIKID